MTHTFSIYRFTDRDIDAICTLVENRAGGCLLPIDKRRYSKQVLRYAEAWRLLDRREDGRLVSGQGRFSPAYDLPVIALWRLVEPMLHGQRSIGLSITKDARWQTLDIWPRGSRFATDNDLAEQETILDVLAQHGYLLVQRAGSIWQITRWDAAA